MLLRSHAHARALAAAVFVHMPTSPPPERNAKRLLSQRVLQRQFPLLLKGCRTECPCAQPRLGYAALRRAWGEEELATCLRCTKGDSRRDLPLYSLRVARE